MTATGPNNDEANYQGREFLDEIFGSQHNEFYKVKSFHSVPISLVIGFFSAAMIMGLFLFNSLFFFIEFASGSVSELTAEMYFDLIMFALFMAKYLPIIAAIELVISIPRIRRNKHWNTLIEDFNSGNNVVIDQPRWLHKIGYVSKLHPSHLKKGEEIQMSPRTIEKPGVYFLADVQCFDHKNKRGSETHTYYETDAHGETREVTYTSYYYYQVAYFELNGTVLKLKTDQYSPAFDTANSYHIIFKISDEIIINDEVEGKILNLFVQDDSSIGSPRGEGAPPANSPQRMQNNNQKAAIA